MQILYVNRKEIVKIMEKNPVENKVIKISIIWFFVVAILIALIIAFFKNYIFAYTLPEENKEEFIAYEENKKAVDILQIMVENTQIDKKMVNEQRDVEFTTVYENNPNLPKDENQTKQEGKVGKIQVTALQEFENDIIKNEQIIESVTLEEVVNQIIYVGTSEFLKKFNVHIEDKMYLLEAEDLRKEASEESEIICKIPRYLDIIIKEAGEEWIKVSYNGNEGYIKTKNVTSEKVMPIIIEKNRIATLKNNLNLEMDLSVPSKLTLSDFKTVLSNLTYDKNKIFEQNAEAFYNAEKKYKINGIFLAAIGIHESAWGTSTLAMNKNNLFGYMAYDRDPYNSAATFETYENGINTVAEALSTKYLHTAGTIIGEGIIATGTYYNGTNAKAVNMKYASDENWANKVFSYMELLYGKL